MSLVALKLPNGSRKNGCYVECVMFILGIRYTDFAFSLKI